MRDEWVASANFETENGEKWILEYFLQTADGEGGKRVYGLRVDKSTPEGVLCEQEETPAIYDSREEIIVMAEAFARGSVPPVTLLEMADEWLTEMEAKAEMPAQLAQAV